MKSFRSVLAGALLTAFATVAQAAPLAQPPGGTNLSSGGSTFTHMLALPEATDGPVLLSTEGPVLLSLSFAVSNNAAAQNDTISLFIEGDLQASGRAATFVVTDLDVSKFFDFNTGTLTFQLFRNVSVGGGNIKLRSSELALWAQGSVAGTDPASEQQSGSAAMLMPEDVTVMQLSEGSTALQISVLQELPEPGTLALLGIGVLGMTVLRRRRV